jgi:hypothetical protein
MKLKILDVVTPTRDLDRFGLREGDVGTIVEIYDGGVAFEVEFNTEEGGLVALLTMKPNDVRKATKEEIKRPARADLEAAEYIGSTVA